MSNQFTHSIAKAKEEAKSIKGNNLEKRLTKILEELEILKPETLLLNADPSVQTSDIIDQIQTFYSEIFVKARTLVNINFS